MCKYLFTFIERISRQHSTLSVKDDHRNYALDYALGLPYIKSVTKIKAQ